MAADDQRCANCQSLITDTKTITIYPACDHRFDADCHARLRSFEKLLSSSSSTVAACPKCSGLTTKLQAAAQIAVVSPSSSLANNPQPNCTTDQLFASNFSVEQLVLANYTWKQLVAGGLQKQHMARPKPKPKYKTGWFVVEVLVHRLGVTMRDLVTDLHFTFGDLLARQCTPAELALLGCDLAMLLALRPTMRQFYLLNINYDACRQHMKPTMPSLLTLLTLGQIPKSYYNNCVLLNTQLGYSEQRLKTDFPQLFAQTQVITNHMLLALQAKQH
jgi:hypothetical protein